MHGKFRGSISKFNGILWSVPGSIGIGYANEIIIIINLKDFFFANVSHTFISTRVRPDIFKILLNWRIPEKQETGEKESNVTRIRRIGKYSIWSAVHIRGAKDIFELLWKSLVIFAWIN